MVAKQKSTELKTLESNLSYVRSTYRRMILEKAKLGKPVDRLVERLKSVEIQLWNLRDQKDQKDGISGEVFSG